MFWTRAFYRFAVDHYGGQGSRLYAMQCRLARRMRAHGVTVPERFEDLSWAERRLYQRIHDAHCGCGSRFV